MARAIRSTSSSRLACISWASRSAGLWIITFIGTSSLVSPSSIGKICRIRQSFSLIILPLFSPRRLYYSQTENMPLCFCRHGGGIEQMDIAIQERLAGLTADWMEQESSEQYQA